MIGSNRHGFDLSDEGQKLYKELSGKELAFFWDNRSDVGEYTGRNDPDLIKVIETLGSTANTEFTELKVVEVPDGVDWFIGEDDLGEYVGEKHRTWR